MPKAVDDDNEQVLISIEENEKLKSFVSYDSEFRKIVIFKNNVTNYLKNITVGLILTDES